MCALLLCPSSVCRVIYTMAKYNKFIVYTTIYTADYYILHRFIKMYTSVIYIL